MIPIEVEQIIKVARNCLRITFYNCTLIMDLFSKDKDRSQSMNFGLGEFKTEYISLSGKLQRTYHVAFKIEDKLTMFLKAISTSNIKKSLKVINFYDCGLSEENIQKLVNQYELNQIEIDLKYRPQAK